MSCTLITTFNIRTAFLSSFLEINKKATMIEDQRNIKKCPTVMNLILNQVENTGVSYSSACALYPNAVASSQGLCLRHLDAVSLGKDLHVDTREDRRRYCSCGSLRIGPCGFLGTAATVCKREQHFHHPLKQPWGGRGMQLRCFCTLL